jgi:hypothetical protein
MKWRSTVVYLLLLLLAGAVYFVIDAKQKQAALVDKESKRVLVFDPGEVKEIEIRPGETGAIHLVKGQNWQITQPVVSDVDRMALDGFISALHDAEKVRKIDQPGNAAAFGLDKPSLVIRLLSGSQWLELQTGAKNPSETSRYARTGEGPDFFMISSETYGALSKSLKDLRRKELFTWQTDQVSSVEVKWQSGEGLSLERQGGEHAWKSIDRPEVEIKARKVRNLLDELHWLRAVDFAGKDAVPSGVEVEVELKLKDGSTSELKVASPDQAKKQATAVSSEIGPVVIASRILEEIPKSADSFADRSLVSLDADDIVQFTWKTGNGGGSLVRIDDKSWGARESEGASPKALENSSRVKGFLASLENLEYIEAVEPASKPPDVAPNSVEFVDAVGKKSSLVWDGLPSEAANPVTVWVQRDGATRMVKARYPDIERLNESLAQLVPGAKEKH